MLFGSAVNKLLLYTYDVSFPVYIWDNDDHNYYGLPIHGNSGVKIGLDVGGPAVTADTRGFLPDPIREQTCTEFLRKYLPQVMY